MSAHNHVHTPKPGRTPNSTIKRPAWASVLNLLFLVVEVVVGTLTGSLALLSDALRVLGHQAGSRTKLNCPLCVALA